MTIHVATPDHGELSFAGADGWETHLGNEDRLDEGSLWLPSKQDPGQAVAEFAKGAWLFVYETDAEVVEVQVEVVPRVWDSIHDVPEGVTVRDTDGDQFYWRDNDLYWRHGCWGNIGPHLDRDLAPFTEQIHDYVHAADDE